MPAPWEVARDLRWAIVRGILLDPITWLGVAVASWALHSTGVAGSEAALLGLLAGAVLQADQLLFRSPDNDLLRAQPLGPHGLLQVRQAELGWWLQPVRLLAAAAAASDGGWWVGLAVWAAGGLAAPLGLRLAIETRSLLGPRALPAVFLLPLAATLAPLPWTWEPVVAFAGLAGLARLGLRAAFVRKHDLLASRAATAPPRRRRPTWRILYGLSLPLVLVRVRTRVVRDLVLLFRGCDAQGALLLLLSPLSCLVLLDELATLPSRAALPWRVLTSTALGAAAVAYAVGPGIHRVRIRALAWERTCPNAGPWAMRSALAYGLGFAVLHCAVVLATLARADSGRFAAELPGLILPVLVLGTAMAHYVVVFTLASARGRRILGEGTLVLSLPFVALGVALLGILWPLAAPLYFVVTLPWLARSAQHWDAAEVSW